MEEISKGDALQILSDWERRNQPISVLCVSPAIALSSVNARIDLCLDDSLHFRLADQAGLRIFISGAMFSKVGAADFPAESAGLPKFRNGIRVDFQETQMQLIVLA